MADRHGIESRRPDDCGRRNGKWGSCRHLKEISGNTDMDGETYHCDVCGEHYRLVDGKMVSSMTGIQVEINELDDFESAKAKALGHIVTEFSRYGLHGGHGQSRYQERALTRRLNQEDDMPLEVEPLDERRKRWRACQHSDLFFGSGGHFIWCANCGAEWTASYDGGKYDDNRAGPILNTAVHRVIVNQLPK